MLLQRSGCNIFYFLHLQTDALMSWKLFWNSCWRVLALFNNVLSLKLVIGIHGYVDVYLHLTAIVVSKNRGFSFDFNHTYGLFIHLWCLSSTFLNSPLLSINVDSTFHRSFHPQLYFLRFEVYVHQCCASKSRLYK